jgi:hypothetical protein
MVRCSFERWLKKRAAAEAAQRGKVREEGVSGEPAPL